MSIERLFISSVLNEGAIEAAVESKISDEWFKDPDHTQVWLWVVEHWTRHSKVPDARTLKQNFPSYRLSPTPEPLNYYIEQMRDRRKNDILQTALAEVSAHLEDEDADAAAATMSTALQEVNSQVSSLTNESITDTLGSRITFYDELTKNPGKLRGYATGFRAIDQATRGVQPEQFIVLIGPQKSGKSALLMNVAINLNEESELVVLMVSFEMSGEEMKGRHDAFRAHVSANRLLSGRMTKADRKKLVRLEDDLKDWPRIILSTDISAMTTVSGIRAQMEMEKPDIVLIDGMYLMEDERGERHGTPQAYTNISRDLKRLCQATKIPIIGTTQALENKMTKKGGLTAAAAGYSSAWGQDCNVMLGVHRHPERDDRSVLQVLLSRSGPLARTEIEIDWENGAIHEDEGWEEAEDDDDQEEDDREARTRY